MNTTPHWKRVWVAVAGKCKDVTPIGASGALDVTRTYLLEGITMYKPYTEESYKICMTKISDSIKNPKFKGFVRRLSKSMNLDADISWAILCNYLMFECYKKIEDIEHVLNFQAALQEFTINLWQFYSLERMYVIRILNHILENHKNTSHPFHKEYNTFVEDVSYKRIQQSLFKQFLQLVTEINYRTSDNCIELKYWVERNNGEQLQILLSILITMMYEKFGVVEFLEIFKIFREHNFTHTPHHMDVIALSKSSSLESIKSAEIGIFIASFQNFWGNQSLWYSHADEIDQMIQESSTSGNISTLLLAWVMLQTTLPEQMISHTYHKQLQEYLCIALNQNVFLKLAESVSDPAFNDSLAGLVMKTAVLTVLDVLCLKFGGDKVYENEGSIDLLSQLLCTEQLGVLWFTNQNKGVMSLYNSAMTMFPYQFSPFSRVTESLISLKYNTDLVIEELCNLNYYTEKYVASDHEVPKFNECIIDATYKPYQNDLVVFPPGAEAKFSRRFDQIFTTIKGNYSYFRILLHIVNQFFDEIEQHSLDSNTEKDAIDGFKVLIAILQVNYDVVCENPDVKELLRLSHCLLFTTTKKGTKNIKLMKFCFEIAILQLRHNHNPDEIVEHLRNMKFLPQISKTDFSSEDFFNTSLTQSTLVQYIQEEFTNYGSCDLLLSYIKLVQCAIDMSKYYFEIQIPGLMFLVLKMFPTMVNEFYTDNAQNREVSVKLVKMVYNILHKERELLSEVELLIYDCIIQLFLNHKWYIGSLVKIFEIGNTKLELFLTTEMNWKNGKVLKVVKTIKRALCCLMFIFTYISSHSAIEKHRILEEYLYLNYDISSLKCVAGYINHSFDFEIPKIACCILAGFAKLSKKPLLQVLELDDYQVQFMFLDRLRDPLVENNLKVTILTFINACFKEQTSMIAAFFNVSPMGETSDTSIISFMKEYLQNIEKDPALLGHPLQAGILELFHGLWKMGKQHIIKELTEEDNFWNAMISPLFKTAGVKIEVLLCVLEILILHMYSIKEIVSEIFDKAIAKIFEKSNRFIDIWINRLIAITQKEAATSSEVSLPVVFLTIWKKFILAVRHFYPEYYDRAWNIPIMEQKCFKTLLLYTKKPSEMEVMMLWAELCLTFCTVKNDADEKEIFNTTIGIIGNFSQFYELVNDRCKTTILTATCVVLQNSEKLITRNVAAALFLLPFGKIFELESIHLLEISDSSDRQEENFYYNWVLILRVINTFLRLDESTNYENFFLKICYLERITDVLKMFMKNSLPVRIAEVMAMTFIDYAESGLAEHYEKTYWYIMGNVVLPNKCYSKENQLLRGVIPQHFKDWWTILSYIVRLNGILLQRRRRYMAKEILSFVITHYLVLTDGIASATVVAESCNLKMVIDILRFVYDMLNYLHKWTLEHGTSLVAVMNSIKEVLNTAIGVILRPKILVFVPVKPIYSPVVRETNVPEENLVDISNNFVEIITWACMCFSRCSPPFIKLLEVYRPTNFYGFLECDFRVPPVVNSNPGILTYGSLLCSLHFICKTLSQISLQEKERASETSLNVTPRSYTLSTDVTSKSSTASLNISSIQLEEPRTELPRFNVFIYPSHTKETPETISALHRFTIPDTMGLQSWLIRLNSENLLLALNAINTFLAGQAFLTIHDTKLERSVMRYIRRELCSELLIFYDFVNKYVSERTMAATPVSPGVSGETRIIATPRKSKTTIIKTPPLDAVRLVVEQTNVHPKEGFFLNVDVRKICTDRPAGKSTVVTSIDDCYLLVLAHWFRHVCRLVHYSKFDEFLSQWHAKSTCVMPHSMYVKNTSVRLSDDEDDN